MLLLRPSMFASVAAVGGKAAGGGTDPDAEAYFTAVTAAGGTINTAGRSAYTTFIAGLKTDGLWALIDRLWCWNAQDAIAAVRDIKAIQSATPNNTPTFTAKTGYDFNGTTQSINTNFNPSTAGGVYTQNSAHLSQWATEDVANSTGVDVGTQDATARGRLAARGFGSSGSVFVNDTSGLAITTASSIGMLLATRTGASVRVAYKNGVSIANDTQASSGLTNRTIYVGANNNAGSIESFGQRGQAMLSIGAGMDATQAANFYTRANTFIAAMSAS